MDSECNLRRSSGSGTASRSWSKPATKQPISIKEDSHENSTHLVHTLVEPGRAKTNFGVGLVTPPAMAVYEQTPFGEMRRMLMSGTFRVMGDPIKIAEAIINSVDCSPAPARLTLGRDAYTKVRATLTCRIAVLDTQKTVAFSTETDD